MLGTPAKCGLRRRFGKNSASGPSATLGMVRIHAIVSGSPYGTCATLRSYTPPRAQVYAVVLGSLPRPRSKRIVAAMMRDALMAAMTMLVMAAMLGVARSAQANARNHAISAARSCCSSRARLFYLAHDAEAARF